MLKVFAFAAMLLSFSTVANAKPTYLACEMIEGATRFTVDISADEETGKIALVRRRDGYSKNFLGAFTADRVIFRDSFFAYSLNRVDLTVVRDDLNLKYRDTGTCKVVAPPKRAF